MLVASGGSVVGRLVYAPPGRSDASDRSLPRMESISAQLRRTADPVWSAQHEHAFVRGIGDGTAGLDGFKRYVRHDYVFLVEYARLLALGAARAPDLATMRRFGDLAQVILGEEMDLHRAFARELGIGEAELEAEAPLPVTRAYTDFLLRTAALGSFGELAAALLPCMWGYPEIGARLSLFVWCGGGAAWGAGRPARAGGGAPPARPAGGGGASAGPEFRALAA